MSVYTLIFFVLMPNCILEFRPCKTIPKPQKKLVIPKPTKKRQIMKAKS